MKKKTIDAFNDASIRVPFIIPEITKNDKNAVLNALNSRLLTDGPKLHKFESVFAKFTGAKFAVGVSNGTAALHLSLKALGIGKGSEVIIPDLTFVATASSVLLTGATPVLVDVDEDLNISIPSLKKAITTRTKAIIPVHFAGKSCKIRQIASIAKKNHIAIVEDCAHAIETEYKGVKAGNFGDFGCFSFYSTKNVVTGEGGMVITKKEQNAKKIKIISYEEMLEMASLGAKMNPRSIELAALYDMPLYVASTFSRVNGTFIHGDTKIMEERKAVTGIAVDRNVSKISVLGVMDRPGVAAGLLKPLSESGISVDVIVQNTSVDGTTDFTFTVDESVLNQAYQLMKNGEYEKAIESYKVVQKIYPLLDSANKMMPELQELINDQAI